MFFSSTVRLREDLTELRHPQADVLFSALPGSLAVSVDDFVEAAYPLAEISVLALPLQPRSISSRSSSSRPAGPLGGRPLGHQSSRKAGSVIVRPRASPGAMPARTGRPQRKSSL